MYWFISDIFINIFYDINGTLVVIFPLCSEVKGAQSV